MLPSLVTAKLAVYETMRARGWSKVKLARELGQQCSVDFQSGLNQTIRWYLEQEDWWRDVTSGAYKAWIDKNYGFRIAV